MKQERVKVSMSVGAGMYRKTNPGRHIREMKFIILMSKSLVVSAKLSAMVYCRLEIVGVNSGAQSPWNIYLRKVKFSAYY